MTRNVRERVSGCRKYAPKMARNEVRTGSARQGRKGALSKYLFRKAVPLEPLKGAYIAKIGYAKRLHTYASLTRRGRGWTLKAHLFHRLGNFSTGCLRGKLFTCDWKLSFKAVATLDGTKRGDVNTRTLSRSLLGSPNAGCNRFSDI